MPAITDTGQSGNLSLKERLSSALETERLLPEEDEIRVKAVRELVVAIEDYHLHLAPEVSLQRKELRALADSFASTLGQIEKLSPQSLSLYCGTAEASIGSVSIPLRHGLAAARAAAELAFNAPNKLPDHSRNILAWKVARVMRDTLCIRPAATRDTIEYTEGEWDGAAYARLLRQVLTIAGDNPPVDLYPLIERGLAILANPLGDLAT